MEDDCEMIYHIISYHFIISYHIQFIETRCNRRNAVWVVLYIN